MPWPDPQNQLAFLNGAILLLGVLLYALLGGADFGGGIWDLLAGGPRAAEQRKVIAHAIGPLWEANHVWLIFVIVLVFTVFPPVFAALSIALYIPLSLALLGIVFRGAAFIFRTPARNVATGAGVWDRVFAVAVLLFVGIAAYALFGGADFGGGIWDLLAGGDKRGAAPREAIDMSVTLVWEGNHVWSIFVLVILWTAFPPAFAAIMTALFVPIALALLGIFFRGIGFAFRHEAQRLHMQRLNGAMFAISSLMAPFFLGTVIGAVATGAVPAVPAGEVPGAWTSTTALLTGGLFVTTCAYIGAIYLAVDSEHRDDAAMARYFSHRALGAGVVTGVLAAVNLLLMRTSAPYVFDRLVGPALPLLVVSVMAGIAALVLVALRRSIHVLRISASLAVAAVVAGWGWAQYPWLLPGSMTLLQGAAPSATLWTELAVTGLAVVLVFPAFGWLYWLQQHGRLKESETSESLRLATAAPGEPLAAPASPAPVHRENKVMATVLIATVATELLRQLLERRRNRRG